jgi:hypothetical protein
MLQTAMDTPLVTNVRWNGGQAQQRPMAPQQVYSKWLTAAVRIVLLFGVFSFFYFMVRFVSSLI